MAEKPWGVACEVASAVIISPSVGVAGVLRGAATAANGGKFSDGADAVGRVGREVIASAGRFGDKNNDELTKAAIKIAGGTLGK